jgi:hypothetical protein
MITRFDVYVAYRRAKANKEGKGFRLPKEWNEFYNTKLTEKNREYLDKLTGYFNTTYSNINIDKYMECGFDLWKSFSYHMFLRKNIIDLYKEKDKQQKRKIKANSETINSTFDFINQFMNGKELFNGYNNLQSYCKIRDGHRKTILEHYMKGLIDPLVIVYCLYYKYLKLDDVETQYIYNITNRYRDLIEDMFQVEDQIKEREG